MNQSASKKDKLLKYLVDIIIVLMVAISITIVFRFITEYSRTGTVPPFDLLFVIGIGLGSGAIVYAFIFLSRSMREDKKRKIELEQRAHDLKLLEEKEINKINDLIYKIESGELDSEYEKKLLKTSLKKQIERMERDAEFISDILGNK